MLTPAQYGVNQCRQLLTTAATKRAKIFMPGKPFQSKLHPHWETIRSLRRGRKTWVEIAQALTAHGCTTSKQDVHAFYKRKVKGRVPLGFEEPLPSSPALAEGKATKPRPPEATEGGFFESSPAKATTPKKKPRYNVDF